MKVAKLVQRTRHFGQGRAADPADKAQGGGLAPDADGGAVGSGQGRHYAGNARLPHPGKVQHRGILQVDLARVFGGVGDLQDVFAVAADQPGVLVTLGRQRAQCALLAEMLRGEVGEVGHREGGVAGGEGGHHVCPWSEVSQCARTR
jgi:hypothetical protein